MVADTGGRRAGTAAETVDGDDIRAAPGDAAGDGGNIMNGGNFYADGFFVLSRFFQ